MSSPFDGYLDAIKAAEDVGGLLLHAEVLANSINAGEHGRQKVGFGDDFWQYRTFENGYDSARDLDYRRSAKQDQDFVKQVEWKTQQCLHIWVDPGASMRFSSKGFVKKHRRAVILALALAIAAEKGGELIALCDGTLQPSKGRAQILRLAESLEGEVEEDYSAGTMPQFSKGASALLVSDFFADLQWIEDALARAVDKRVRGVLLQLLDPSELQFPFRGRTIFQSVLGSVEHKTLQAGDLRSVYLERMAVRQDRVRKLAEMADWSFFCDDGTQNPKKVVSNLHFLLSKV